MYHSLPRRCSREFCLSHRTILEVGWGLQEATWHGRFQPRLHIRILLWVFRNYGCPGPILDQLKLILQSRAWP